MTDLISHCFKDKNKKLVTFVTGGDPDFETSKKIIETINVHFLKNRFIFSCSDVLASSLDLGH